MVRTIEKTGRGSIALLGTTLAWQLLDVLSPSLLCQPLTIVSGGLRLVRTDLTVITDAEMSNLLDVSPVSNTVLLAFGPYGLCADVWTTGTFGMQQIGGAPAWIDPATGCLWFLQDRLQGPAVRVSIEGAQRFSQIPMQSALTLEQGFAEVAERCKVLRERC